MSPNAFTRMRRTPRILLIAAISVAVVFGLLLGTALVVTSEPGFFARYRGYKARVDTLATSSHAGLHCADCHSDGKGQTAYRVGLVGDFYQSLFVKSRVPAFTAMEPPSSNACRACHEEDWSTEESRTALVPHPAHLRVASETRECVTCHKWTAHQENYMEKHHKMPFSSVCASFQCHVGWKQPNTCASCHHSLNKDPKGWKTVHRETVRENGPNGCLEKCHKSEQCRQCHTTGKRPEFKITLVEAQVKSIEDLHVRKDWLKQHGKVALADEKRCYICHQSKAECKACHSNRPAFHGAANSWIGKHQDVAKGEREKGCYFCHSKSRCDTCHKKFKEMQ